MKEVGYKYLNSFWLFSASLAMFMCYRLIFLAVNQDNFFWDNNFTLIDLIITGALYDANSIFYFTSILLLILVVPSNTLQKNSRFYLVKWMFFAVFLLLSTVELSDIFFYRYNNHRLRFDDLSLVLNGHLDTGFILDIPDFWVALIVLVLISFVVHKVFFKFDFAVSSEESNTRVFLFDLFIFSLALLHVSSFYTGAGYGVKKLDLYSLPTLVDTKYSPFVTNASFSILSSYEKQTLKKLDYVSSNELEKIFPTKTVVMTQGDFKPLNVVIIVLESFSAKYIDMKEGEIEYTPFLNSLKNKSLYFKNAYSNAMNTREAMPAIFSSVPALMEKSFITSIYSTNNIPSIVKLLNKKGYQSAFFYGGDRYFGHFDHYIRTAGFDAYHAADNYPNKDDLDGSRGVYDGPYLQHVASELLKIKEPFVAGVLTLSSHVPFRIPVDYPRIFAENKLDSRGSKDVIRYTDQALRDFFSYVHQMPWFENTLFVLTGDHPSGFISRKSTLERFAVPLFFYRPGAKANTSNEIVQSVDILPSILDYLNFDEEFFSYGNSVFSQNRFDYAVNYRYGDYYLIGDSHVLVHDGKQTKAFFKHERPQDINSHLKANFSISNLNKRYIENLNLFRQNFNNRMISNQYD